MSDSADWTVATASAGLFTVARTYEVSVRMAQAYAAGVDDWNPAYFNDDAEGPIPAPPCLVYSLQWNARHMPGADLGSAPLIQGVHSATDLRFERPLCVGDVLTVQGRRIIVEQRSPGVYVVTRFQIVDPTGKLVATVDDGVIVRGAHTDGPDVSLADTPPLPPASKAGTGPGARPVWSAGVRVSRGAPHVYTECADIWNPIHTERRIALVVGLPDIILQGSATMAIAARELVNRVVDGDPTRLVRLSGQFRAMVIPGNEIVVNCSGISGDEEGGCCAFFEVLSAGGESAVKGGVALFRPGQR